TPEISRKTPYRVVSRVTGTDYEQWSSSDQAHPAAVRPARFVLLCEISIRSGASIMMRSLACNGWIRVQDAAARRILRVQSALRIALCRLRYPNVAISFDSFVGRNVVIRARRGAQIRL